MYEYLKVSGQVEKIRKFKLLWGENPEWVSKESASSFLEIAKDEYESDLLDEHLELVDRAIRGNVIR